MTLANTCAPFIAVPIAWALLRLKRMLPGTRYASRVVLFMPQEDATSAGWPSPAAAEAECEIPDQLWLPVLHPEHEHYIH